jgi:hypothetical protein
VYKIRLHNKEVHDSLLAYMYVYTIYLAVLKEVAMKMAVFWDARP